MKNLLEYVDFSIYRIIYTIIIIVIGYLFMNLVIKPYMLLKEYQKQGCYTKFRPFFGATGLDFINGIFKYKDPVHLLRKRIEENPNIKVFASNIKSFVELHLIDPVIVKDFLANPEEFQKESEMVSIITEVFGDNGLIFLEGATWKKNRRLISSAFNYELFQSYLSSIQEIAKERFTNIPESEQKNKVMLAEFQEVQGLAVGKLFFGEDLSKLNYKGKSLPRTLNEMLTSLVEASLSPMYLIFGGKISKKFSKKHAQTYKEMMEFRQHILQFIQKKKEKFDPKVQKSHPDLLEILFKAQLENPEDKILDTHLVDHFLNFFFAGTDTTSHTLDMTLYQLAKNPDIKQAAMEEINTIYQPDHQDLKIATLNKMEILNAIMKECLRMYPPPNALLHRKPIKDIQLGNLKVKKGTLVTIHFTYNNFNPEYHDEPLVFKIDRWMDPKSKSRNNDSFCYIPFSGGPRNCIGQHFAQLSFKIILSEFMKLHDFDVIDGYNLVMGFKTVYEPVPSIQYVLKPKQNQVE